MTSQPGPISDNHCEERHQWSQQWPCSPRVYSSGAYVPGVVDDGDDFDLSNLLTVLKRRALTFVGVASLTALGLAFWHVTRPSFLSRRI